MKRRLMVLFFLQLSAVAFAQQQPVHELSLGQALEKALERHQQLTVSAANIAVRKQQKEVAKLQQLPALTFSANAYYLGDVLLLNSDLSKAGFAGMILALPLMAVLKQIFDVLPETKAYGFILGEPGKEFVRTEDKRKKPRL